MIFLKYTINNYIKEINIIYKQLLAKLYEIKHNIAEFAKKNCKIIYKSIENLWNKTSDVL